MGLAGVLTPQKSRAVAAVPQPVPREPDWSLPLVAVAGALWGHGMVTPFDEERAEATVEALDICASDQVLLVGAGPGGAERLLRGLCGADITAYEHDPLLALLGGARSFRPQAPDFGRAAYDMAIVLDIPARARTEDVLAAVARALRPEGRMLIEASLPDPDSMPRALRHLRCTVEAAEDCSLTQVRQVVAGWSRLARQLDRAPGPAQFPPEGRRAVMREAERWMPRVGRLRRGTLHHVRLLARGHRPLAVA